ncbi:MAG: phospholipid carrier-dependent glycosyltransferase [Chloroflexota bacterium]|nr:phospholipid carrier-dependent glycosyltransferase [Chloroflexota bacterium]
MTEDKETREREAILLLAGAIAVGVAIRLLVFRGSGFPSDVGTFMAWAQRMAEVGPGAFYAPGYFSDYPPGFLYVLWAVGALFHGGEVMRLVVKALSIPADIAIAIVLFRVVRPYAGATVGAAAGAIWMLQPGPIFAGPFWGQVDAWGTLPFLLALVAAAAGSWTWAGALAGVALMVKPQFGLVGIVVVAAAVVELIRAGHRAPLLRVVAAGLAVSVALALPFGMSPSAFVDLVRRASETYPYTSLFAFNVWSIVGDFWKPDASYVVLGGVLLVLGILGSVATLWSRRDLPMLLVAGALAAFAFYFLPTRAHERYLFPAFALLAPFAVTRRRILVPYVVLAVAFFVSLYFAFTRYPQNGLTTPPILESTLFSREGQIALAALTIALAALLAWRLVRGEARLDPDIDAVAAAGPLAPPAAEAPTAPSWRLPAGLRLGHAPTRRDVALALFVALAVIATRGFRLDQPRDMYFDEVYHARTAFELLAQREPYEWTHPQLAKEIMALGIMAFGGDDVAGRDAAPTGVTAFAVSGDGERAYGDADGNVHVTTRSGSDVLSKRVDGAVRAIGFDGADVYVLTDRSVSKLTGDARSLPHDVGPPTSFAMSKDRAVVGGASAVEILSFGSSTAPLRVPIGATALTVRPDDGVVYVADAAGTVHLVDPATGKETGTLTGGAGPVSALAYATGPQRLYGALAGKAALEWFEPPAEGRTTGAYGGTVELSNGRTGTIAGPITALAEIPRTDFLYALTPHSVVVVESHGASPYVAIPVTATATALGVDGTADELLVLGHGELLHVPTGDHALAWRIPGVLLGGLLAFFVVLIAVRLFASPVIPVLAGATLLLDGSMFAQPRIGMNDVYVGAFLVAAWYFVIAAHAARRSTAVDLLIAGLLFGLAAASKWAAFYALAGLGLYAVVATAWAWRSGRVGSGGPFDLLAPAPFRRTPWRGGNAVYLFACFAVVPLLLYVASYARWYGGPTIPYGWNLWELQQQMYWYHSGLTSPHPAGSPWWSWPFVLKPVYWYLGQPGQGMTAVIYDAGNVVLFWGALAAMVWGAAAAIRARSLSLACLVFAFLTQYVAWVPITRVLFFYHFFTALPFYLLVLAAALGVLWETGHARLVTAYLALAGAAFVFFYPFVSGQPVPADQASVFYVLPTWQYDCQFYPSFHCPTTISGEIPVQAALGRVGIAVGLAILAVVAATGLRDASRLRELFRRRSEDQRSAG